MATHDDRPRGTLSQAVDAALRQLREDYPEAYADRHLNDVWRTQCRFTYAFTVREWWSHLFDRAHYGDEVTAAEWRSALAAARDRGHVLAARRQWELVRADRARLAAT